MNQVNHGEPVPPSGAGIEIRGLTVTAGGRRLLEDTSASFPAGQITLIVGPSGVGKSILLRIMSGLIEPADGGVGYTGSVTVSGRPNRLGDVGVVFQAFALFDELTPLQNVAFARANANDASEETAEQLLQALKVPVDVPTSRLSGGQRQRLAIARTLAFNPPVILYDEPTSGLDPSTGQDVASLIQQTHRQHGKTSIVVTHDYHSLLPIADRVYLLDPQQQSLREVPAEQWEEIPQQLQGMAHVAQRETEPSVSVKWSEQLKTGGGAFLEGTANFARAALDGVVSLVPTWKTPRWGFRFLAHYARLVAGPTAWIYLIIAGIISGFVVTYFTFKFLPYAAYTEPLLLEDLLTALGFATYRIFVPVLACILVAARCGAAVTSDIGGRQFGNQIDALKTLGASPRGYLMTPIVWAFLVGTPLLTLVSYGAASTTSLVTFVHSNPDQGPDFWNYHFHRGLFEIGAFWYRGTGWLLAKLLVCGFGVAVISYYLGRLPKYSSSDVSRAVTSTILWSTLYVLLVHFLFAFYEYEGLAAGNPGGS
ncbi:MAG: ABC transporter permease [Mariniblastus sp.]|nr:ABC transporter permease [Mariniblastus sp.]